MQGGEPPETPEEARDVGPERAGSPAGPSAPPPSPGWPPPPAGWPSPPADWPPPPAAWPPPPYGAWPPPPGSWPPPGAWPPPQGGWPPPPGWAPYPPSGWRRGDRGQPYPGWTAGYPQPTGTGRFRPLGLVESVDAAFTLFRRNFLLIVAIAAVIAVPEALINLGLTHAFDISSRVDDINNINQRVSARGNLITQSERDSLVGDVTTLIVYLALLVVLELLILQPIGRAATVRAVSDLYLDRPASIAESFRAALRALGALIGASLLQIGLFAALVGVLIALVFAAGSSATTVAVLIAVAALPFAILLYIRWWVAPQAIVIERVGPVRGLARSWQLTRGSFWRTVWLALLLLLITVIASAVLNLAVAGPLASFGPTAYQLAVRTVIGAIVSVLVTPITLITTTLYYYDLRIRREAFDLEMLAESL